MTDDQGWNPTPPGWISTPTPTKALCQELWRLMKDGRTITCELRDETKIGGGFDVVIRQDDELSFSRRCPDEAFARFVAKALRQDQINAGWAAKGGA
jgi:hypothetical protein